MTREEAKEIIGAMSWELYNQEVSDEKTIEALNMAIEALEKEPICCKDCKHWHEWENGTGSCHRSDIMWVGSDYDDYCSFAERRESDEE